MSTNRKPRSKRTSAAQSHPDWVKEIERRVNANPALVAGIKEGYNADPRTLVRAKDYFESRFGRPDLAETSTRVRDESMRVNAEFAAFERDPDPHG